MTVTDTEGSALQDDQMRELVDHAMALEADGDLDGAIGAYEQALMSGYTTDEVCYNLALLYKQQLLYEDALTLLGRCLDSPEYGASAHYASAECQLALGNFAAAADHFDAAIAHIALDQIPDDQVPDVRQMFQVAIDTFRSLDREDRAAELRAVLEQFLAAHGASPAQASMPPSPPVPVAPDPYAPAQPAPPVGPLAGLGPAATGGTSGRTTPVPQTGQTPGGAPSPATGDLAGYGEPESRPITQRGRSTYRRLTTALEQEGRGTGQLGRTGQVGALDASRLLPPQTRGTGQIAATYIRRPVRLSPILPLAGEAAQPPAVRALLERAAADLERGCYDAAVDDCQQAITEAPDYLPAHLRLAEAYAGQGLLSEAAAKCHFLLQVYEAHQEAVPTMPVLRLLGAVEQDNLEAWTRMAELYFAHGGHPGLRPTIHALVERAERQGQTELALEYAERLIEHSRDDDEARQLAAALQLRGGNPHRALTYYQTLLRRDRNDMVATAGANVALTIREGALHWPSLERLVSLLRDGGTANDAVDGDDTRRRCLTLYRQVIPTAERAEDDLYVAAGLAHLAVGDGRAALGYLDAGQGAEAHFDANGRFVLAYALTQAYRAAGVDPGAERHWLERASELLRDPGVSQFAGRTALFDTPVSAGILHADLAESMLRAGQVDEAMAMLQRLTEEHPDDAAIRHAVAAAYHRQGKLGQALDELDKLANQQLNAGKLVEMAETLRKMSEFAGENLAVKSRLADLFLKRGFPDEALREFDRIAAIHQSRGRYQEAAEVLRRAADTAWIIGRQQDAFALYDRVLELAPDNVMLRQAYINCLLQGGQQSAAADQQRAIARTFIEQRRIQESIAALHQVIVLDPKDAEAYNRLGEALASVGEYAQAERVYRRLVRLTPEDPLVKARQTAMAMLVREQGAGAS